MQQSLAKQVACSWCGDDLPDDEVANPEKSEDGEVICSRCWLDHYYDDCPRCKESVEKSELASHSGDLIALWEECSGCTVDLAPGYYRVLSRPFMTQGLIGGGWFHHWALRFVCELDERGLEVAEDADYPSGPLCRECRAEIEHRLFLAMMESLNYAT